MRRIKFMYFKNITTGETTDDKDIASCWVEEGKSVVCFASAKKHKFITHEISSMILSSDKETFTTKYGDTYKIIGCEKPKETIFTHVHTHPKMDTIIEFYGM